MENIDALFRVIEGTRKKLGFTRVKNVFFRGHAAERCDLLPTLFRKKFEVNDMF
jgi:hypothetical protein